MHLYARPRTARAIHRLGALVVALLWCLTPVLAALHAQAEAHRLCAEHGQLEEVVVAQDAPGATAHATVNGVVVGDEAHEGCAFGRYCRFGQLLAAFGLFPAGDLAPERAPLPELAVRGPTVSIVRFAPKTSPPV